MNFFRAVSQKLEKDPRPGAERPLLRKLDTAFAEAFGNTPAKNAFTVFLPASIVSSFSGSFRLRSPRR